MADSINITLSGTPSAEPFLPTATQKAALAGTGTPSSGNKFVTKDTLDQAVLDLVAQNLPNATPLIPSEDEKAALAGTDTPSQDNKFVTASTLANHTEDIENPHGVTKDQIGLGSCDNTADADKPVSTAQQSALDLKVDKVEGKGLSANDYTTTEKDKLAATLTDAEFVTKYKDKDGGFASLNANLHIPASKLADQTDLNADRLTQDNLSDELISQIAGTTAINPVIADGSVTGVKLNLTDVMGTLTEATSTTKGLMSAADKASHDKLAAKHDADGNILSDAILSGAINPSQTTFVKTGKNKFNKNDITAGYYVNGTSAGYSALAGYNYSGFIAIKPSTSYHQNKGHNLAWFDKNKTYISGYGDGAVLTATSPSNAAFCRVTVRDAELNVYQFEEGNTETSYEEFHIEIALGDRILWVKGDNLKLANFSLPVENMAFITTGKNIVDKADSETGYILDTTDGVTKISESSFHASNFIPCKESTQYTRSTYNPTYFYNRDKKYIGCHPYSGTTTFTTPAGTYYLKQSWQGAVEHASIQVEEGTSATAYEEQYYKLVIGATAFRFSAIAGSGLETGTDGKIKIQYTADYFEVNSSNELSLKDSSLPPEKLNFCHLGKNLFDKDSPNILQDTYIYGTAPGQNALSGYHTSDYIPVTPGEAYTRTSTHNIAFYGASKNYVSGYGDGGASNTITVPADCYFLRVVFTTAEKDSFQVEKGSSSTTYEAYKYVIEGNSRLEIKVNSDSESSGYKKITLENSDKIILFGNSYTASHFTLKDKAYVNILSMFSDYSFRNYGVSGDDVYEILTRVRNNTALYNSLNYGINELKGTYGVIICYDNNQKLNEVGLDTYYENTKKLIIAIKSVGMVPVLSTEHLNPSSAVYMYLKRLSEEYGLMFCDIAGIANAFDKVRYAPYWGNGHPATRTNGLLWANLQRYLDTLPRPKQGIKLFRQRPSYSVSTVQDLYFETIKERAERFKEITIGHVSLGTSSKVIGGTTYEEQALFDRLDELESVGFTYATQNDEYIKLQAKQAVSFSGYNLVECILPITNPAQVRLFVDGTFSKLYAKTSLEGTFPTEWDGVNISADYQANYKKPAGSWTEITKNEDGYYYLPGIEGYVEHDKVTFLMYNAGSFNVSDIYLEYTGAKEKISIQKNPVKDALGQSLLAVETFKAADFGSGKWTATGSVPNITLEDTCVPDGIEATGMIQVNNVNYVTQGLTFTNTDKFSKQIQIKVWARYSPSKFTGASIASSPINLDSFDFAGLSVEIKNSNDTFPIKHEKLIGLHWQEVVVNTALPVISGSDTIAIKGINSTNIQIAKVQVREI